MKKFLLFSISFFALCRVDAQTPNWAQDIAPILYANCTKCHNPTGVAPFSLLTYVDAYSNSVGIQTAVLNHVMPPWPPDPNYRHLAHERILSQSDIDKISDWVNASSPSGDTTLAPPKPFYSGAAQIPSPDLTGQIPSYTVTSTNDIYRCFVIPSGLLTQKYITEIEVIPGNRSIVHHVLVYEDTSAIPVQLDNADPGPGYTNFGGTGSLTSNLIGAWVPGATVYKLPAGMGMILRANTNIIMQIHYPAGSFNQSDDTKINFKLSNGPLRPVSISPILNHYQLDNGPLNIPANTVKTFTAHYTVTGSDMSVLSVGPHMHLIGQSVSSWAVTPTNVTIPFISIPSWNFHWQGSYEFQTVQKIPNGTTLYSSATYDNTPNNPYNPNSPPKTVSAGEATTDEMMLIYFAYTPYLAGDENIILDSTSIITSVKGDISAEPYLNVMPNPFNSQVTFQFYLREKETPGISLYDLNGRLAAVISANKEYGSGLNSVNLDLSGLSQGVYLLRFQDKNGIYTKKLVKT